MRMVQRLAAILLAIATPVTANAQIDSLPSWNDGAVERSTTDFARTILLDRVRDMATSDPSMKVRQPFKAILEQDREALSGFGEHEVARLVAATHAGMTTDELMNFLRANGFKPFIVSGGGIELIRAYAEENYGIPPEQVVRSSLKTRFELRDGRAVLVKLPELDSLDDKEGRPVNINLHVGRRPIAAFGNSYGDLAMLQSAATGPGARLAIIHHDDAEREVAYDRQSGIGRLDKALDEAGQPGWTVVSMKRDWKAIFPTQ